MKKLTLILFAFVAFLFTSLSASAENSFGNVYSNVYQDDTLIIAELFWTENDSPNYIQTFLSYDSIPRNLGEDESYSMIDSASWGIKWYLKEGKVQLLIPAVACQISYIKLSFIDGVTQKRMNLYYSVVGTGTKAPVFQHAAIIPNFTSVDIGVAIQNNCNSLWCEAEIFLANSNIKVAEKSVGGYLDHISMSVYDLVPNQEYDVRMVIYNGHGSMYFEESFITRSNLPPVVESLRSTVTSPSTVELTSFVDTKNTNSTKVRYEYGEQIGLENLMDWFSFTGTSNYTSVIDNLKPNTVYFWRLVAMNLFGQDEGQIKMFKTNQFATAITEITSDDLLQVSSCPAGIRVYPEKDAVVEIFSITGEKILTTNLNGGEAQIFSSLTPGVYIVKSSIEGFTVTKKAMVN